MCPQACISHERQHLKKDLPKSKVLSTGSFPRECTAHYIRNMNKTQGLSVIKGIIQDNTNFF